MAVKFYERGAGHATFFTKDGVVIALTKSEGKREETAKPAGPEVIKANKGRKHTTEAVNLTFVGADKKAKITAGEAMPGYVNYFVGSDRSKWRSNIPTYGAVTYRDVYKDIDIKFYGNNKNIEHDVIVRPGGDPSLVKFAYKGVKGLKLTKEGGLEVRLNHGSLIQQRPVIYQEIKGQRVAVDGSYRLLGQKDGAFTYGFDVASYDHDKAIVIDPVITYSTFLGGSGEDIGVAIAVDSTGAAYITGDTQSADFPLMNPIQGVYAGGWLYAGDAFITKINPAGSALVYSTYLGGSGDDRSDGIAVDSTGAAYVTGDTRSTDFPLATPIQGIYGGIQDAFITKVNPSGSALVYSTYLGGSNLETGNGITLDASGNAYVTGLVWSTDFPLMNPIQGINGGLTDAFVTKINPAGSAFVYSTYLGGSDKDQGYGVAVDASGNAYVTGDTSSWDFPLVAPLQRFIGGGVNDAFITKISGTPPPVVQLTITPDAVSIARGGTLGYSVTATNTTVDVQCFNYWEDVTLPNGSTYPPTGALFGPLNVCLNGNGVKNVHLTHGVPMAAPVGAYIFNAYVGAYPIAVVDEAHFNFDVTAFNPATQNPQDSWRLLENGFRQ